MKYYCVEDQKIVSVLDYEPNTPTYVKVYVVSDADQSMIDSGTKYFDATTGTVVDAPTSMLVAQKQKQENDRNKAFLDNTDWMVLRHVRQRALGLTTSLTEDKYLELERQRQSAAESILT